jgi:uncharacterized membrane protein
MADEANQKMEAYLGKLRQRLRGMNDDDAREIVEELRSHIRDKAAASGQMTAEGVDRALASLGSPEDLASQYMTDDLLARAVVSRSPLRIVQSLFRWASLSIAGLVVLLCSIVGIFPRRGFHCRGRVEAISSWDGWPVEASEPRR